MVRIAGGSQSHRIPVQPASGYRLAAAPVSSGAEYARLVDRSLEQAVFARAGAEIAPSVTSPLRCSRRGCAVVWPSPSVSSWAGAGKTRLAAGAHHDTRLQGLADAMSTRLPSARRPRVLLSPRFRMPFTFGVLGRRSWYRPLRRGGYRHARVRCSLTRWRTCASGYRRPVGRVRGLRALLVRPAPVARLRRDAAGGRGVLRPAGDDQGFRPASTPGVSSIWSAQPGVHPAAGSHHRPGEAEHRAAARRGHPAPAARTAAPRRPRDGRSSRRVPVLPGAATRTHRRCAAGAPGPRTTRISERGSTRKTTGRCAWKHRRPSLPRRSTARLLAPRGRRTHQRACEHLRGLVDRPRGEPVVQDPRGPPGVPKWSGSHSRVRPDADQRGGHRHGKRVSRSSGYPDGARDPVMSPSYSIYYRRQ